MGDKGVVFQTKLSIQECGNIFRDTAEGARGIGRKSIETIVKMRGGGEAVGYYTPTFNSPFAAIDGVPDFAIGINLARFMNGANGAGFNVQLYVDDEGERRNVELHCRYGGLGGGTATKHVTQFLEQFRAADPQLVVTQSNI